MKDILNFGSEEMEEFTYTGTELKQNSNFSVKIYQDSYINSIQEIALSKKKWKTWRVLSYEVRKPYMGA